MGRDFAFYLTPPTELWHDRQQEHLEFNVSRHNDVIGYHDSNKGKSREDLTNMVISLGNSLNNIKETNVIADTLEAIKVYCAVLGEMGNENTVWIKYR